MVAITGGPCGGKSSFVKAAKKLLAAHDIQVIVVSEMATELITAGITPWGRLGGQEFQRRLMQFLLSREDLYIDMARKLGEYGPVVILCDRGALDAAAYVGADEFDQVLGSLETTYGTLRHRYDLVIHLVTAADGAEEAYTLANNVARTESPEVARELDQRTQMVWVGHPHHAVIDNRTDFPGKIAQAVQALQRILPMPQPLEIEVKYRILNFTPEMLPPAAIPTQIVQTYLVSSEGEERRVRQATTSGELYFTYTEKLPTGKSGTRVEHEHAINEEAYLVLLEERDPTLEPIVKTRHRFVYDTRGFEVDVYTGGRPAAMGLVTLEIELQDMREKAGLKFPPGWELEDVTDDKAYKNKSLAKP